MKATELFETPCYMSIGPIHPDNHTGPGWLAEPPTGCRYCGRDVPLKDESKPRPPLTERVVRKDRKPGDEFTDVYGTREWWTTVGELRQWSEMQGLPLRDHNLSDDTAILWDSRVLYL